MCGCRASGAGALVWPVCVCVVCVRFSGIVRLNVEGADSWLVFSHSRVGSRSLVPLIHLVTKQALARALGCFNGG
jgi:hypothetical protein